MSSLLECPFCKKTLDKPVILPCGHSICKKHEQTNTETSKISCPTCYIDHNIPKNSAGFVSNLLVESLLEHKLAKLDLGPEHRLANESLKDLGEIIDEFKRIRAHPDLEIDRVVTELKFKIDLKREVGKKANDDSLQLISDLDKYIKDCKENLGSDGFVVSARIDELIESVEKKIPIWTREMNMFERNVKKWRKIQEEAVKSYDKLRRECDRVGKIVFNDRFDEIVVRQKIYCEERIMEPLM